MKLHMFYIRWWRISVKKFPLFCPSNRSLDGQNLVGCLFIHPPGCLSIRPFCHPCIHPSTCYSIYMSIWLDVHSSIHPSGCPCIHFVHPFIHPLIHSPVRPSIWSSVHSSICASFNLVLCLFIHHLPSIHKITLVIRSSFMAVSWFHFELGSHWFLTS